MNEKKLPKSLSSWGKKSDHYKAEEKAHRAAQKRRRAEVKKAEKAKKWWQSEKGKK